MGLRICTHYWREPRGVRGDIHPTPSLKGVAIAQPANLKEHTVNKAGPHTISLLRHYKHLKIVGL